MSKAPVTVTMRLEDRTSAHAQCLRPAIVAGEDVLCFRSKGHQKRGIEAHHDPDRGTTWYEHQEESGS